MFEELEQAGSAARALELLVERLRADKDYPRLFDARLMQKRVELDLPLASNISIDDLPEQKRGPYEQAFLAAAREVGELFLAGGDIARAWPYFRAVGDAAPVRDAIERAEAGEGMDAVIQLAIEDGVNPRRGFELLLAQYGICRAITFFEHYQDRKTRPACLALVVRTLYEELVASLRRAIESVEGSAPGSVNVLELIDGREWLFEGMSYHVDTSHLMAVLRFALEVRDRDTLQRAREMAGYGTHLNEMYHYKTDPPFENVYLDHQRYLQALLGEDVDAAVAHFRGKLDRENSVPAQVLVTLLARVDRLDEAIEVSREWLADISANDLACPSIYELCERAGRFDQMLAIARERGDALNFVAGLRKD
jgi:hypothetical protein